MSKKYRRLKEVTDKDFFRLVGVTRKTFDEMCKVVSRYKRAHKRRKVGGAPRELDVRDSVLMMLEYYREYRTQAHIALDYGVSESTCGRTIRWVENLLIKDEGFKLPGKKALWGDPVEIEAIVIDASESPIQRPKKKGS